jgi:DNA-binding MarR family transcriptional regulator
MVRKAAPRDRGCRSQKSTDGAPAAGTSASDDVAIAARALFALGRTFAHQPLRERLRESSGRAIDLSRVLVVQAVDDGLSADDGGVTVGTVAERLGIDPSTASRLVADATRDGYLARSASQHDGRRACLALTGAGRLLVEASRRFQRQVFLEATSAWPEEERTQFARLFVRFAEAIAGQHAEVTNPLPGAGDGANTLDSSKRP